MKISVKGEQVSEQVVGRYVSELVKAHPDKNISSVDIIVDGDRMKIKMSYIDLGAA